MLEIKISFVMLAKNEETRIKEAIEAILKNQSLELELIVIDDHSTDSTYELAKYYSDADTRIRLYKNKYTGKVLGTNFGYSLAKGNLIKFVDADDVVLPNFFQEINKIMPGQSHCHSATIVSSELRPIARYAVNPLILDGTLDSVVTNLISLPKWSWTFSRDVAKNIFPIPEGMPIEDLWISIRAKQFSSKILASSIPCYLYRQHSGQDYGGILNFAYDAVAIRASRSLEAIDILGRLIEYADCNFSYLKIQLELILSRPSFFTFIQSKLFFKEKVKLALIIYAPSLASLALRCKWFYDTCLLRVRFFPH